MLTATRPPSSTYCTCLPLGILLAVLLAPRTADAADAAPRLLENERLRVSFDEHGLTAIHDKALGQTVAFAGERFTAQIGQQTVESQALPPGTVEQKANVLSYRYQTSVGPIEAVYELQPGWRFVSKQLRLALSGRPHVKQLTVFQAELQNSPVSDFRNRGGSYGVFLRFAGRADAPRQATFGMFAAIQNPFLKFNLDQGRLSLAYEPDMDWSQDFGPFESDRICLGTYSLSGTQYPMHMLPEWQYVPDPQAFGRDAAQVDIHETLALTECVRAFLTYQPKKSIRLHVDWCENAYQIDIATPEGWQEYQRIIQRAADVGCDHLLFSPQDSQLASLSENRDAWGWESLLWLNLGQKIRKGEWVAGRDPLPAVVQQRLDFAAQRGIRLVSYAYPSLPFMQNPQWTKWLEKVPGKPQPGGYLDVDTGDRSFQDWFVQQLVAFTKQTKGGGFSFDHWWIAYKEASSPYAQWNGCRRILLELRKNCPDIVIDGRQQYHWFGAWTWVAGSYPHPLGTDEQPQSFKSFPDLHWSRGSADRQRYQAWAYRMHSFAPVEIMPGYMTHQTMRNEANGNMARTAYRLRDFDYLGWKYSVMASIGTAPINHVVNYLPARDTAEYEHFSRADRQWLRDWFDWTDRHIDTLRHLRPIIGQPMVGRCDGTAAVVGDRGFIFLFNPNYRRLDATFKLDQSLGLTQGSRFVFRQLYPDLGKGRLVGHPQQGCWKFGQEVSLPLSGASALVLELVPVPEQLTQPMLLNSDGQVALAGEHLQLQGVRGEPGTSAKVAVLLPGATPLKQLTVNGRPLPYAQAGNAVTATVPFAGQAFTQCQPIGQYDPQFRGPKFSGTLRIPRRIFDQLAARKAAWPIPYDAEELKATWNAPHRLLLFVNIADPQPKMEVSLKVNGQAVEVLKAYSSVYAQAEKQTFLGFYADLSALQPDTDYPVEVGLPELQPGQFQGLFCDNIEAEFTTELR